VTPYLYARQNPNAPKRDNGLRFWGYPQRTQRISLIAVHTTESVLDLQGEDTGAESVARYQSTTDRPSSYHRIVDRDSTVVCLPDEATAFGVVGYNSRALSVSLAMRAADWTDPAKAGAAEPTLRRAAAVVAEWCRKYDIPVTLITKAQADAGQRGITSHGRLDPARRSDPGAAFPWDRFLTLVRAALGTTTTTPTEEIADMTPEQSAKLDRIHFELTNPFQSRVVGAEFRDTAVGMVLNTDASQWRTERGVQQLLAEHAALRAAVAANAGGGLTPEQVTQAAKDGALAALDERISEARVEITPKETA